jgi:hypothetical protein
VHKWLDPKTGRWRTRGSPKVSRRVLVRSGCPHAETVDGKCTLCSAVFDGAELR